MPGRIASSATPPCCGSRGTSATCKAVADQVDADYVLLGQLQRGETDLRFITHFIRLADEAHLKANRLIMPGGGVAGLEDAVVEEFERAVTEYVLNPPAKSLQQQRLSPEPQSGLPCGRRSGDNWRRRFIHVAAMVSPNVRVTDPRAFGLGAV